MGTDPSAFAGLMQDEIPQEEEEQFPEELSNALLNILRKYDVEDRSARNWQVRLWKKLENYFKSFQTIFWDDVAHDYRSPLFVSDWSQLTPNPNIDIDPGIYPRIVNIYRAYMESIIAALSSGIPYVRFYPEDADNGSDLETAKAYSKISQLIEQQNKSEFLFMHALFILCNQSFVACYNYAHESEEYGTTTKKIFGKRDFIQVDKVCPNCGMELSSEEQIKEEYLPEQEFEPEECPQCGEVTAPVAIPGQESTQTVQTGEQEVGKTRVLLEVYGPLNVKVPTWVRRQKDTPYLSLETEIDISLAKALYPKIADKITTTNSLDTYDRWGRQSLEFAGNTESQQITLRRSWIRNWAFEKCEDEATRDQLKQLYPNGCYVVFCNDIYAESYEEKLDDHWTITETPLSSKIHAEPLGFSLMYIQEMVNDLINITMQTCQFGIAEMFADPEVVNFEVYGESENAPGTLFPAIPKRGSSSLQESFFQSKPATLSREIEPFKETLMQAGQLVSGALPSIFGGINPGGSKTLGEYEQSRTQAMQRLSLTWKMLVLWWTKIQEKAVTEHVGHMLEDEKIVQKQGEGFVNSWIRKSELTGSVGRAVSESSDQLPISWQQKNGLFFQLVGLNNEMINSALFTPENAELLASIIGMSELKIPGAEDRIKQLLEIAELIKAQPTQDPMMDQMTGQPVIDPATGQPVLGPQQSTIPIEPNVDNHEVHIQVSLAWLNGEAGRVTKETNPGGYQNVVAHLMEHNQFLMSQMPPPGSEPPVDEKAPV